MNVVIYPRVSSLIQADSHSIESQLHDLPLYVKRKPGWKLVGSPDDYKDDGRSAKTGTLSKRTGLLRLLKDAARKPRPFDVVVVIDAKRLTRTESWDERGFILGTLQKAGVKLAVASADQLIDLNTDEGDLLMSLETHFSAKDNRSRRESIMRGKLRAIRENRKPAGPTPFGLLYSRETREWSKDPELGPIVIEIYRRIAKGETCGQIAADLNKRGIMRCQPSKSNGPNKRKPGRWTRERVHGIARTTTYIGEWVANKNERLIVKVPPLITHELWSKADKFLDRFSKRGRRRTKHVYLVQGAGRCGICGAKMVPVSTKSGKDRVWYYTCSNRRRRPVSGERCKLPMQRLQDIDDRVWQAVVDVVTKPKIAEAALRKQAQAAKSVGLLADTKAEAEAKLSHFDAQSAKLLDQFTRGEIPEAIWDRHRTKMRDDRAALQRRVEEASAGVSAAASQQRAVANVLEAIGRLRTKLKAPDQETRRDLVQALIPGTGDNVVTIGKDGKIKLKALLRDYRLITSGSATSCA